MNRCARLLVLCAILEPPAALLPANLETIAQADPERRRSDRSSIGISGDGRFIAFASYARLVAADANDTRDIYVLDRTTGSVALESPATGGTGGRNSSNPRLSHAGRFLIYETHLDTADGDPLKIVFRDRQAKAARILGTGGAPSISGDGQRVAFASELDVYLADVMSGVVQRIPAPTDTAPQSPRISSGPAVSATGRYVAFVSSFAVYIHDVDLQKTSLVSVARGRLPSNGRSWAPSVSADGRYVAFVSTASNLVVDDDNQVADVFVADWQTGSMELVSRTPKGRAGNDASGNPAISADGRFIAFQSEASDLDCIRRCAAAFEDINLLADVFLFDRTTTLTTRLSRDEGGPWMEASMAPALDAAARVIAFSSRHPISRADRRNDFDLFVATR